MYTLVCTNTGYRAGVWQHCATSNLKRDQWITPLTQSLVYSDILKAHCMYIEKARCTCRWDCLSTTGQEACIIPVVTIYSTYYVCKRFSNGKNYYISDIFGSSFLHPGARLSSLWCLCMYANSPPSYTSYKGNLIQVERSREKQIVDFSTGSPWETVTLTALGRDRTLYTDILQEGTH